MANFLNSWCIFKVQTIQRAEWVEETVTLSDKLSEVFPASGWKIPTVCWEIFYFNVAMFLLHTFISRFCLTHSHWGVVHLGTIHKIRPQCSLFTVFVFRTIFMTSPWNYSKFLKFLTLKKFMKIDVLTYFLNPSEFF